MEKLTKEKAHDLCVETWNEVAENNVHKCETSPVGEYSPEYDCFACEFYRNISAEDNDREDVLCKTQNKCPFSKYKKRKDRVPCDGVNSPFRKWEEAYDDGNEEASKKYAIAIADLFI